MKNIILALVLIAICFTATAAKKIPSFVHPQTGMVYVNAHLRFIVATVDEESNTAMFRFDVFADKNRYQAGKQPVWSGYVTVAATNYNAVIKRSMQIKDIAMEQGLLHLTDATGSTNLVLSGSSED